MSIGQLILHFDPHCRSRHSNVRVAWAMELRSALYNYLYGDRIGHLSLASGGITNFPYRLIYCL